MREGDYTFSIKPVIIYDKSEQYAMRKGLHLLAARYYDHNGGSLKLLIYGPSGELLKNTELFRH